MYGMAYCEVRRESPFNLLTVHQKHCEMAGGWEGAWLPGDGHTNEQRDYNQAEWVEVGSCTLGLHINI